MAILSASNTSVNDLACLTQATEREAATGSGIKAESWIWGAVSRGRAPIKTVSRPGRITAFTSCHDNVEVTGEGRSRFIVVLRFCRAFIELIRDRASRATITECWLVCPLPEEHVQLDRAEIRCRCVLVVVAGRFQNRQRSLSVISYHCYGI